MTGSCSDSTRPSLIAGLRPCVSIFAAWGVLRGSFDSGVGELSDAASALDWVQSVHPEAQSTWIAGYSFGALIGMQLLMRRPEVRGFISVAPPANMYDFSFLAPALPASLLFPTHHSLPSQAEERARRVMRLVDEDAMMLHEEIPRASRTHFFDSNEDG